jgi:hypothetical protein
MNENVDRFYNLLPSIYRQRDAEQGFQLMALLRVLAEQANAVESDIAQLFDNWFIETCQDWVVPYIGTLVGYQQVHEAGEPGDVNTAQGSSLNKILISRRDVANTIHARRRKGTLSLLEDLSRDVANWPYVHAVEFYKLLGITQTTNYTRLNRGRTVDIRESSALKHVGGPFAHEAHTIDVRRIISNLAPGRYNLPSVGLFIWRLQVYSVTKTQAFHMRKVAPNCYTFSPLGNDTQLYNHPQARGKTVDELNFPSHITRQGFKDRLNDYYGAGKSMQIWTVEATEHAEAEAHGQLPQSGQAAQPGHPVAPHSEQPQQGGRKPTRARGGRSRAGQQEQLAAHSAGSQPALGVDAQQAQGTQPPKSAPVAPEQAPPVPIDPKQIIPADLSEWRYHPQPGYVAVDPVLGRIVFPPGHQFKEVLVSYYYGFSDDIGGGEYHRSLFRPQTTQPETLQQYYVGRDIDPAKVTNGYKTLRDAVAAWENWKGNNPDVPHQAVIEIVDSGVYHEQPDIYLEENESLQIRAADRKRPVIRIVDWDENLPDVFKVSGELGSSFTLDGLLLTGSAVQFNGDLSEITVRHCTFVPGWGLQSNCEPHKPTAPSIEFFNIGQQVTIEHSIIGSILVYENEAQEEPLRISISDSVLDATKPEHDVFSAPEGGYAYAVLTIARCTVFGCLLAHALELAENSIFRGLVRVARRQWGCMRFCSLTPKAHNKDAPGNRTPRRYHCQPDLVDQALVSEPKVKSLPPAERAKLERLEQDRVRPLFNSMRYGMPTYCQLAFACAQEIKRGADDESEMGVFHELYQPQREANLRARLDDYTPAGMETGIIYVS